ncbi:DJ-1/PfpI family protein [Streptomyces sp. NPDC056921]|uniref:DJ-1/PfpI family protein n=1 Tax=Streptomyces sp. NPDC056921 TaxID=3345966 RepID=UPI00362D2A06
MIPLFDRFEPLDAIGPYEILAYVPGATVRFVTAEPGLVQDVLGSMAVHVPTRCSEVASCDVPLVPGGGGFRTMVGDPAFLDRVRRIHTGTRFTTSVCTGSPPRHCSFSLVGYSGFGLLVVRRAGHAPRRAEGRGRPNGDFWFFSVVTPDIGPFG